MQKRDVNPGTWQDPFGFSQAVEVTGGERVLYCAGQTSNDAEGEVLHEGDIEAQVVAALDNLEATLAEAGFALGDVVRINTYTTDVDAMLGAWDTLVGRLREAGIQPAMTLLGVSRLAFPGLMVEFEATAVR